MVPYIPEDIWERGEFCHNVCLSGAFSKKKSLSQDFFQKAKQKYIDWQIGKDKVKSLRQILFIHEELSLILTVSPKVNQKPVKTDPNAFLSIIE